jgi:hypothetical protein
MDLSCYIFPCINSGRSDINGYIEQIRLSEIDEEDFLWLIQNEKEFLVNVGFAININNKPWNGHYNKATSDTVTWIYDKPENTYQLINATAQLLNDENSELSFSFWDYSEAKFIRKDKELYIIDIGLNSPESPEFLGTYVDFHLFATSIIAASFEKQSFIERLLLKAAENTFLTQKIKTLFSIELIKKNNKDIAMAYAKFCEKCLLTN